MKNELNIEIGHRIKKARDEKGYSQQYMADVFNLSQRNWSKMENGEVSITIERLFSIAKELKTNVAKLLGIESQSNYQNYNTHNGDGIVLKKEESILLWNKIEEIYEKRIAKLESDNDFLKCLLQSKQSDKC